MARRARRNHSPAFKAKVALEAVRGVKTAGELAQQYDIHPNLVSDWKQQLLERAAGVFGEGEAASAKPGPDLKELHAKIGRQALEIDFLEGALGKTAGPSARR
jgi:transposase-like protein